MFRPNEIFSYEYYDLSLRLYSSAVEAELVNGNIGEVEAAMDILSKHVSCSLDIFPSSICLIKAFTARGKMMDALSTGFDLLEKLGVSFPKSTGTFTILRETVKTKMKLRGKTDEELKKLPVMKDNARIATMRILATLIPCCFIGRKDLLPIVFLRMVRMSVKHGISPMSPLAFANYGYLLSVFMGNSQEGYRFGELALSFLEKFETKEVRCKTVFMFLTSISVWRENSHSDIIERFTYASKLGMEVGDHEFAMRSLVYLALFSFFAGRHLAVLHSNMDSALECASSLGQEMILQSLCPTQQCVLNLMGRSNNPLILRGTAMNEDDFLDQVAPENFTFVSHFIHSWRTLLAYTFCEYEMAVEIADKIRMTIGKVLPGTPLLPIYVYYDALAACALLRESNDSSQKHKEVIKAAMKKMKGWAANSPSNFEHKVLLLEAEYDAAKGKTSSAHKAYDGAVNAANKSGMIQDEALAYERAALFLRDKDEAKASLYFAIAHQLYVDWGADAKSLQLETKYSKHVSEARTKRSFQDDMTRRTAHFSPKLKSA